jgi:hypothetical protein
MKLLFKQNKSAHLETILTLQRFAKDWELHGPGILRAFEEKTGINFKEHQITVRINKDPDTSSYSGTRYQPMLISQAYTHSDGYERLAVLTHELAHRLLDGHGIWSEAKSKDARVSQNHKYIYLFLYDVWEAVFGKQQAVLMGKFEEKIEDKRYQKAWLWAMSKSYVQRQKAVQRLVQSVT